VQGRSQQQGNGHDADHARSFEPSARSGKAGTMPGNAARKYVISLITALAQKRWEP
jgi:hypothetical protein